MTRFQRRVTHAVLAVVATGAVLIAATACSSDTSGTTSSKDTVASDAAANLLGPDNPASGEPVKIGMVSDGATAAYDNTDELRAAKATAAYYNDHQGGIGGRPIELVTCETQGEASTALDCANKFIADGVVAVAVAQSAVLDALWQPLHSAGIATFILAAVGDQFTQDDQSTFLVYNPLSSLALPVEVAQSTGSDNIAFPVIDIPQAVDILQGPAQTILDKAGLKSEIVRIPIGTADMTSQMQQVKSSGAGVVLILGNDAFCIAAFQGLQAVQYQGAITVVSQCITDATREAMAGQLQGIYIVSNFVIGATDDPTYQKYLAVMQAYGSDVSDINNATSVGGYGTVGALFNSLAGISGDINPQTVIQTIKGMDQAEVPAAGGVTFKCGGSASPSTPAVCTNQALRTQLDANGEPTTYTVVDSSDLLG